MVCIDTYENIPGGRFYNALQREGGCFSGLMQFLLKMERVLDTMHFPRAFSSVRTFSESGGSADHEPSDLPIRHGRLATFEMRILFRQNASWQGSIAWLEGGREESFRSVLELAMLMDSALSARIPACPEPK